MDKRLVTVGSDHRGFELKEKIVQYLFTEGYLVQNMGTIDTNRCDFPDYAQKVCEIVSSDPDNNIGILICGTGIGMSMAANRFKGVRCGLCHSVETAKMTRLHNNANVLALGSNIVSEDVAKDMVKIFLETDFLGDESYQKRNDKLDKF